MPSQTCGAAVRRFNNRAERRAAIADMHSQCAQYPVGQLVEVAREDWPADVSPPPGLQRVWRDRRYLVQQYLDGGTIRLSVNIVAAKSSLERLVDGIPWDELQRIKNQCGYGNKCAVELFPPEASVVNVANIRHLWLLREPPAFMWGAKAREAA